MVIHMYTWIWAVLIVQGSLAVFGSLYMSFVKQKEKVVQVADEPSVVTEKPQQKSLHQKLLF